MAEFSGQLVLRAEAKPDGRTVLAGQSFRAPYHLSKPYWDGEAGVLLVQVVNPTAGILAGDRLESRLTVGAGAALLVTTPSASRVFRMREGTAECRQHFAVAPGGWLEVMPEPLVPHRGSRFRQVTTIAVESGAGLFFADLLMPGRVGHGEVFAWDSLEIGLDVRIDGDLVLRERLAQTGGQLEMMARLNGSGGAACFANAILIAGPRADDAIWTGAVAALHGDGLWVGISRLRRGGWTLKLVAPDSVRLRQALKDIRAILAGRFERLRCDPRKL